MSLEKSAEIILKECMAIQSGERVLIVIDKNKKKIGDALLKKAGEITETDLVEIPVAEFNGEEPPEDAARMMMQNDVIIIATTKSLSHTDARRNACKAGARIASMPGITEEIMERALSVDHKKMTEITEKINNVIFGRKKVRIITEKGTNVNMIIDERHKFTDQGLYHKKGDWGNLPAGEAGGAPVEGSTNGMVIVDRSMAGVGKVDKPIKLTIKDGNIVKIEGGEKAEELKKLLKDFKDERVYNIAELGIGTNEKAKISGCILEDEKVLGTAHIGLGNNTAYGGSVDAPCHLDGIFSKPTIFIDGNKIIEKGKILL